MKTSLAGIMSWIAAALAFVAALVAYVKNGEIKWSYIVLGLAMMTLAIAQGRKRSGR